MANSPHPSTLSDHLRSWSPEQLETLLRARPDLATPPPQDSVQLAARATTLSSMSRALDQLSTLELFVLDAVVLLDAARLDKVLPDTVPLGAKPADGVTPSRVIAIVHAPAPATEQALDLLTERALLWHVGGGLRAPMQLATVLRGSDATGPSGLHPYSADAASSEEVAARLRCLSEAACALLAHVDDHGGLGTTNATRRSAKTDSGPVGELLDLGLLVARERSVVIVPGEVGVVIVPGEVGVALRGGHTTRDPIGSAPNLATVDRNSDVIEQGAAGAAFEFVRRVELLLDRWGTHPPGKLRSGGLGVRELRQIATMLGVDEATAAVVVEVSVAAGLAGEGVDAEDTPVWLPTDAFDGWSTRELPQRWLELAAAWLDSPRTPSRVGSRDRTGKARNALHPELSSPLAAEARQLALAEWVTLPHDTALATQTGAASLVARARWQRPRRPSARDDLVLATVSEAAVVGIAGAGAICTAGRAILTGDQAAAFAAVAPHLPRPVDHLVVQADLTAIAPGPLASELTRALLLVADVESRGGATVYRFTRDSVRRAFDAGWSAAEVHDFVGGVSATQVPQPLRFLIDDVSRTFGQLRVGQADAFLRADDPAVLTELMHQPEAASWGLRQIAPTVVVSNTPVELLLLRLRELGLAPVVEAPDGTVHVARRDLLRARRPRQQPSSVAAARAQARIAAAVTAVRAGDQAERQAESQAGEASTSAAALAWLRHAIEERALVTIEYVDSNGGSASRLVEPRGLEGGRLSAHDRRTDCDWTLSVHRITAVAPPP